MVRRSNADNLVNQSEFGTEPCVKRGKHATGAKRGKTHFGFGFCFPSDWLKGKKQKQHVARDRLELLHRTVALFVLGR